MRRYVVYMHVAPNGKRYFGITSMSPERRWGCGSGYCHNPHFSRAIQHYGWSNIEHVVLLRGLSETEAQMIERRLIMSFQSNEREYGYNITDGGEAGKRHSQESIEKMRAAKVGVYAGVNNPMYGRKCSDETKQKISQALSGKFTGEKNPNYGKQMSEEQKELISKSRRGKHYPKLSEAMKNSPICKENAEKRKKPVLQYTLSGDCIAEWQSAPEASVALLGHSRGQSNICSCANGRIKSAYGFVWRYPDETNLNYKGAPE